jgi:hypothetical protein
MAPASCNLCGNAHYIYVIIGCTESAALHAELQEILGTPLLKTTAIMQDLIAYRFYLIQFLQELHVHSLRQRIVQRQKRHDPATEARLMENNSKHERTQPKLEQTKTTQRTNKHSLN